MKEGSRPYILYTCITRVSDLLLGTTFEGKSIFRTRTCTTLYFQVSCYLPKVRKYNRTKVQRTTYFSKVRVRKYESKTYFRKYESTFEGKYESTKVSIFEGI